MITRYYAQTSVKRTFKGLTVIAEAFNEIERDAEVDGEDPGAIVSYSLEYQDQNGNAIAECRDAGLILFWHDPISGDLMIDMDDSDAAELTDLEGNPIEQKDLELLKTLAGSGAALAHLVRSVECALCKNKELTSLVEVALNEWEAELKEEAEAC